MTQPITPLRQRMLDDMAIRRLAPGTQAFYVSAVAKFAKHFTKSPDLLGYEDVRVYQLFLVQSGAHCRERQSSGDRIAVFLPCNDGPARRARHDPIGAPRRADARGAHA